MAVQLFLTLTPSHMHFPPPPQHWSRSPVLDDASSASSDSDDMGGFNPEEPPNAGQHGALTGDFTSFATWSEPPTNESASS